MAKHKAMTPQMQAAAIREEMRRSNKSLDEVLEAYPTLAEGGNIVRKEQTKVPVSRGSGPSRSVTTSRLRPVTLDF